MLLNLPSILKLLIWLDKAFLFMQTGILIKENILRSTDDDKKWIEKLR